MGSPEEPLTGTTAWVTGAGTGLGRAVAVGFAAAGATVALTGRREAELKAVAAGLPRALVVPASVADPVAVGEVAGRIVAELGRIDVLANFAGTNPALTSAEKMADADWREVLDVNLSGTYYCCREAGRHMLERGGGSIITVSSVHGSAGTSGLPAYVASKGGVEALTKALAVEWATRGVRVNCLAPGYIPTPMTDGLLTSRHAGPIRERIPMDRFGTPDEIVGAAVFLAGAASGYVTGAVIPVDGGYLAR